MKIKNAPSAPPVRASQVAQGSAPPAPKAPPPRPAAESQTLSTVHAAQRLAEGQRAAQMQQLEVAVKNGGYRPDVGRIAERILASAELDAHLRTVLAFP
jgi:hypothetical protein